MHLPRGLALAACLCLIVLSANGCRGGGSEPLANGGDGETAAAGGSGETPQSSPDVSTAGPTSSQLRQ